MEQRDAAAAMNRHWALLLLLAALALLGGCVRTGGSETRHPWTQPGVLRWTEAEDIDSLNPLLSTELLTGELSVFTQGYCFLPDAHDEPVPSLCTVVPTKKNGMISKDGKTIVYRLRRGVRWQDGAPFTSADIAFTVKTILDPHFLDANTIGYDHIASIATPNAYTVVVHLKTPYAPFVSIFLNEGAGSGILPKHLLAGKNVNHAAYNALPVGLGPFKYVRWSRGNEVVMKAWNGWWGGKPKLRTIVYKIIPDANTAVNQLSTHELDAFAHVPNEEYLQAKNVAHTKTIDFDTTAYEHIDFNLQNSILRDVRVRRALAHAIDTRTIVAKVDHGSGFLTCSPIPHISWAYDPALSCPTFDLSRARALLDAAGWRMGHDGLRHKDGHALRLTLSSTAGNPSRDGAALLIQSAFRQIGAALSYRRFPANEFFAHPDGILGAGKFDLALYSWFWGTDPDISSLYACRARAPRGLNYSRYCNASVDRLLADAQHHYSRARRRRDYFAVQRLFVRDVPSVVLYQRVDHLTINDNFSGINPSPIVVFTTPARLTNEGRNRLR